MINSNKLFFTTLLLLLVITNQSILVKDSLIIDSKMSLKEAIKGTKAPKDLIDSLEILEVKYISTDGKIHQGQLVINKAVKEDVTVLFDLMLQSGFVVEKVIPVVKYQWSDDKSMLDNNSSAFNYRKVAGTNRLSNHALGRAVDINPSWNPVVHKDGSLSPENGKYDKKRNGTFYAEHPIVLEMKRRGWRWGGDFSKYADNHHFDKLN